MHSIRLIATVFLAALVLAVPAHRVAAAGGQAHHARTSAQAAHIPLSFEVNQGQTNSQVRFLAHLGSSTVYLTRTGITLALGSVAQAPRTARAGHALPQQASTVRETVLRLLPVGMSRQVTITGADLLAGRVNYIIGNNPKHWHTDIRTYGSVVYHNVYPSIDLRFRGRTKGLEYDWVIRPGGDPSRIVMAVQGEQTRLQLDRDGNLAMGPITQEKPVVYQDTGGVRHLVAGRFALGSHQQIRFHIGTYDHARPLVIDPLIYSTYLGGSSGDLGHGIAVDSSGNAYVTGITSSSNFPVTPGAFQMTNQDSRDAFVTKLNPAGTALVYSTFLGGTSSDLGYGITVDGSGNAYVSGDTYSTNFPVTPGAFQTSKAGGYDAFVTKLNASGSGLLYSTYLGGSSDDYGYGGIAVDSSGNAYVTGTTFSANFPVTLGAFQAVRLGNDDTFVTELNASGSGLIYSTYLGGSSNDYGFGIAVDGSDNVYVTGYTYSSNFPVTPGAFQMTNHGSPDGFVSKINPALSGIFSLVYSTYLGGSMDDYGRGIAVDASGNAYITGYTYSTNFPVTPGAFQTTNAGSFDAFVTKLNASGSALVYSTYLGGSSDDFSYGIAVDSSGNAYITGATNSTDFPVTAGAFQTANAGGSDTFVAKLNASGSALVYSTYLGGSSDDFSYGIAVDSSGNAYITGYTNSTNFPVTPGAFQTAYGGNTDAFVAKFSFQVVTSTQACAYVTGSYSPSSTYVSYGNSPNQSFTLNATERNGTVVSGSYVTYGATTSTGTIQFHSTNVSVVNISGNNAIVTGTGVFSITSGGTTTSYMVSFQVNATGNNTTSHNTFQLTTSGGYTYDSGVVLAPPPPGTSPAIRVSSTC